MGSETGSLPGKPVDLAGLAYRIKIPVHRYTANRYAALIIGSLSNARQRHMMILCKLIGPKRVQYSKLASLPPTVGLGSWHTPADFKSRPVDVSAYTYRLAPNAPTADSNFESADC